MATVDGQMNGRGNVVGAALMKLRNDSDAGLMEINSANVTSRMSWLTASGGSATGLMRIKINA